MIVQSKKVKKIFQIHNKRASEICRTQTSNISVIGVSEEKRERRTQKKILNNDFKLPNLVTYIYRFNHVSKPQTRQIQKSHSKAPKSQTTKDER